MKKLVLMLVIMLLMSPIVYADTDIGIEINGIPLVTDTSPTVQNGRLLVPVSHLMRELGAEVDWNSQTRTVDIGHEAGTITLAINDRIAQVNGQPVQMDVPPIIINNRTLVPVGFLSENLGAQVKWDGVNRMVYVETSDFDPDETALPFEQVNKENLPQSIADWANSNQETKGFHIMTYDDTSYVLASAGQQPTGGYSVEITQINRISDNQAFVKAVLTTPGPEEIVTMALTYPYDVVRLAVDDLTSIDGEINQRQRGVQSITLYFLKTTETDFLTEGEERVFRTEDVTAENVMAVLLAGPESSSLKRIIPSNAKLLNVTQENDLVYVNFSSELTEANVGAQGESVLVNTIVKTLVQLPGINQVQILVEGNIVETLAGHVVINQPLP